MDRVIFDPGEPVPIRRYLTEGLAALDQALLESEDIPSILRQNRYSEVDVGAVTLIVRREHVDAALRVLDTPRPSGDSSLAVDSGEEL